MSDLQYLRKVVLKVEGVGGSLDLSQLRIDFSIKAADVESPNNARIKIYNLSEATTKQIKEEAKTVTLEAGYEFNCGMIFTGTIKWFRSGRAVGSTDTYLEILAADGDLPYNEATIFTSVPAGATQQDHLDIIVKSMQDKGLGTSPKIKLEEATGGILPNPRGKVFFGMSRVNMRREAERLGATWSIQNNELVLVAKDQFLPGEAIVLTGRSGLIGRPEQTVDGIKARCLINPKIQVASLVKLDNASINSAGLADPTAPPVAYDSYTNMQFLASLNADGLYRVYVVEYIGDTRGPDWFCELTLLAVDPNENLVTID